MRIGRMTGLTLRMMHPGRWKEQSERFEPQRDELAARPGNSFLRYFCSWKSFVNCVGGVDRFIGFNWP